MADLGVYDKVVKAHENVFSNKKEVQRSELCGCFHCFKKFTPDKIVKWELKGEAAVCPFCQESAVLGNKSGFSLDRRFLKRMKEHWFKKIPHSDDY
jgi:hypothetical protein